MDHIYTKPRQRRWGRRIFLLVLALVVASVVAGAWFTWELIAAAPTGSDEFSIEEGWGVNEISRQLYGAGVIRSKLAFEAYVALRGLESSLQAGTYVVPRTNLVNLTGLLLGGPQFTGLKVTLIEGWSLSQIAAELNELELADEAAFTSLVSKPRASGFHEETFPVLYAKPDSVDLEGYLFPDTYFFPKGIEPQEIVTSLINNLTAQLSEPMLQAMDEQGLGFHEILTMASIIEKEVRTDEDRRLVSGVLWKRIAEGIPLQVDSTINYITGGNEPAVSLADTRIDNPFNTYLYPGLPPGPIASPGLAAIMAAIYPEESPYYFYLSTPEGETIFSATNDEHAAAKNKYLR